MNSSSTISKDPYSDSEIAKLLLIESKTYQPSQYNHLNHSVSAGQVLKTNKRFLKSVIRNVNDHNKQLERKPERYSSLRRMVQDEIEDRRSEIHGPRTNRTSSRFKEEEETRRESDYFTSSRANPTNYCREKRRRSDHKNYSDGTTNERSEVNMKNDQHERRSHKSSRTRHDDIEGRDLKHGNDPNPLSSKTVLSVEEKNTQSLQAYPPLPSTSKMDKYFSSTYDPRLDVNLDDITDPTTGLIQGGNYDDWEAILTQLKAKREAKSRAKEAELEKKLIAAQRKLRKTEKRERKKEKRKLKRAKRDKEQEESDRDEEESDEKSSRVNKRQAKKKEESDNKRYKESKRSKSTRRYDDDDDDEEDAIGKRSGRRSKRKRERKSYSSSDSSNDDEASTSSSSSNNRNRKIGLMEMKGYSKPGKLREWDLGKPSPT